MLGYTWCGCTNGQAFRPRAAEWDEVRQRVLVRHFTLKLIILAGQARGRHRENSTQRRVFLQDFGEPVGGAACKETSDGVFEREWTGATVQWDCGTGHGKITKK